MCVHPPEEGDDAQWGRRLFPLGASCTGWLGWLAWWVSWINVETDSYICKEKEMICSCDLADCLSDHVHKTVEKEMATHSSTLAWEIPRVEELDGLQSMGSQGVKYSWACTQAHKSKQTVLEVSKLGRGVWESHPQHHPYLSNKLCLWWWFLMVDHWLCLSGSLLSGIYLRQNDSIGALLSSIPSWIPLCSQPRLGHSPQPAGACLAGPSRGYEHQAAERSFRLRVVSGQPRPANPTPRQKLF